MGRDLCRHSTAIAYQRFIADGQDARLEKLQPLGLKARPPGHEMGDIEETIGVRVAFLVVLEIDQQRIVERRALAQDKRDSGRAVAISASVYMWVSSVLTTKRAPFDRRLISCR